MTEKQLGTIVDSDIHEAIKAEANRQDCSMREIIEQSISLNLGLDDVSSIDALREHIDRLEDDIEDLEEERSRIDNEIAKKQKRLKQHRDNLQTKLDEQDTVSDLADSILDDLVSNPRKTVDAHTSDLRAMTKRSSDVGTLDDAKQLVWGRAIETDRDIQPSQIPSATGDVSTQTPGVNRPTSTSPAVSADGRGSDGVSLRSVSNSDTGTDADTDDDDDPTIMTDGGIDISAQNRSTIKSQWSEYLDIYCDEIDEVALDCPTNPETDPEPVEIRIDWCDVYQYDRNLALDVIDAEDSLRPELSDAIAEYDTPSPVHLDHLEPRICNLGDAHSRYVNEISTRDVGKYREIQGQIQTSTGNKPTVTVADFECQRCGTRMQVQQDLGSDGEDPHECVGCERQGPFEIDYDTSTLRDMEIVRVTEPPERTTGGDGQTVDVLLDGPVVGDVQPGDRVTIAGNVTINGDVGDHGERDYLVRGRAVTHTESSYDTIELTKERVTEIEELAAEDGFERIVESIAPDHQGDRHVKEGIALQLFSGVHGETADGGRTRGDIHVLLCGDPSTGKSTLLSAAAEISPRSASVSGKGASSAGLTAAALPADRGDGMRLEAGAMVLASGGLAAIDELDKIPDEVSSSLHGSMGSQQIVDVNKGGFNTSLPSRSAVLAAANPKHDRYDPYEPIGEQIDLSSTMMSRFDLIFPMVDSIESPDEEKDKAEKILESVAEASERSAGELDNDDDTTLDRDTIRHWIAYARSINPTLPDDVLSLLAEFYSDLRAGVNEDDPIPITPRKLQSLVRLSQASARVRLSDTVGIVDAERAVSLVSESMSSVGVDPESDQFDADVVETGQSKQMRDSKKLALSLIDSMEGQYESGVPVDTAVENIAEESESLDEDDVLEVIDKLRDDGRIYEPQTDKLRTT